MRAQRDAAGRAGSRGRAFAVCPRACDSLARVKARVDRARPVAFALASLTIGGLVAAFGGCAKSSPFACDLNSDCDLGYYCGQEGKCLRDCVDSTRDCPKGYTCNSLGKCEFGSGGAGPGGTSTTGPGSPTTSTGNPTTTTTTGSSPTTTTTTGGGNKGQLDLCNADSECGASLFCRAMTKGASMRCTPACASDSSCPSGFRCEDPGDGTKVCLESDVGRVCTAANQCNYGCLLDSKVCTAQCGSGADCPNGWGCMAVGGQQVCVKAEAYCGADPTKCVVTSACDTSTTQLIVSSCTLSCTTAADCPQRALPLAPWTCNGICQRPGDVYGPLEGGTPAEYACNASSQVVNLCNDAQHIDFNQFTIPAPPAVNCAATMTTQGVSGDACVDSCRYQGACPYLFDCTAVGQVNGQRIGLCLRGGIGEVGDACTTDSQCAFGYCKMQKCSRDCSKDGICPTGSTCTAGGGPTVEGLAFRFCQ